MTLGKPPFHIGIVVEDIGHALDGIAQALSVSWAKVQRRDLLMESEAGPQPIQVCYAYSLEGPPHLELIERRSDTVFDTAGLHHLGVWTNDPTAESARLDELGWPRETVVVTAEGEWSGGLFHRGTDGLRLEVVDIARSGPRLLNYLGGGDYADPSSGD